MLTVNQRDVLAGVLTYCEITEEGITMPFETIRVYQEWRKIIEEVDIALEERERGRETGMS